MNRRSFIQFGSSTTLGILLSPSPILNTINHLNTMHYPVIIIGGGPAGMSAALVLGRSTINTLLINSENARNKVTTHSHGFLTQDGKHPKEIFNTAREQLSKYPSVHYRKDSVIDVKKQDRGYLVRTAKEQFTADRILLATGHRDQIEKINIPGLTEVYGTSIYPCPFCDGFELSNKALAVIGDADMAPMFAKTIFHWSKDLHVFTNGAPIKNSSLKKALKANGVQYFEQKIRKLHAIEGKLTAIELADGQHIPREGGFLPDTLAIESSPFAKALGLPTETGVFGMEYYQTDEHFESPLPGCFIIGDAQNGWSGIAGAVAAGSTAAAAITHQIIDENWIAVSD